MQTLFFACIILVTALSQSFAQSSFQRAVVNVGNIGLSVSNFGTLGNPNIVNNPESDPSMEYPLNTGIEHLFEGGLWIGALVDGVPRVSTAALDASGGYITGAEGFEFTSGIGSSIQQRSTLTGSDFFSPDAVSHQDLVMDFTDQNTVVPGTATPIAQHQLPLGASVHLESYAWDYSFADYFVILNYTVTNASSAKWDSVWLGLWTDLVVRNVNVATDNGAAFFNKGAGGFIDSMQALYAFDVTGDPGYTESYGATQFLGMEWREKFVHPENANALVDAGFPAPMVNANFWNFKTFNGTAFGAPANDVERYQKVKSGLNFFDPEIKLQVQTASNRVQLLSIGPLVEVAAGESFTLTFAMVCARQIETGGSTGPEKDTPEAQTDLINHLGWAQRTFNGEDQNANGVLDNGEDLDDDAELDRFILPEPPSPPHVKVVVDTNTVTLYWNNTSEGSIDPISKELDFEGYRVYRSILGQDLTDPNVAANAPLLGQWDIPGNALGYDNGFSGIALNPPVLFEGDTVAYHYRFQNNGLLNGWQYVYAVAAFDRGNNELRIDPLESSRRSNTFRVFVGTPPSDGANNGVGVYPNPYRINAAWDGPTATDKKIHFYNLPARCTVTIYTTGGDVVAQFDHAADYSGQDIDWFKTYGGDAAQRVFPGGEHAWDLLSESRQTITQGIYMYAVHNLDTNETQRGTFVVIK